MTRADSLQEARELFKVSEIISSYISNDMFYLQVDATTEINSDDAFAIEKVSTKHKYNDLYSMVYL